MKTKFKGGDGEKNFLNNRINQAILAIFVIAVGILYYYNPGNILSSAVSMPKNPWISEINFAPFIILTCIFVYFIMITTMAFKSSGEYAQDSFSAYAYSWINILIIIVFLILCGVAILFILWVLLNKSRFYGFLEFIGISAVVLGVLGLLYFYNKDRVSNAWQGRKEAFEKKNIIDFLLNIIFYVPCLFGDFIDFILKEYKITPIQAWVILLIEILVIALIFVIPLFVNFILSKTGTQLLAGPSYINNKLQLGSFENLSKNSADDDENDDNENSNDYIYNYSISFWFWINPQPPSTSPSYNKYTTILDYGGRPNISYHSAKRRFKVEMDLNDNVKKVIYETSDIPFQKWNHVVINYNRGTLDVFINANLVASRGSIAPYLAYETVTSGDDNGIHGSICNVTYYKNILSQYKINWLYNSLKLFSNPLLI